jgi:peptide/nickel transport system substrate-binding protein
MEGITQDLAAGPRGLWTLRTAYKPGSNELTVGHLWVWTERSTWNPVGGYGDVYSSDIYRNLSDPPVWNDPFTGVPQPFRAAYEIETAGPAAKLEVPADAFVWSAEAGEWVTVGADVEATSKVTFDYSRYFQAKFHHGQPITMADLLYSIYQGFDLSYNPDKARIETVLAVTARPTLETFRGFRVVDENTIEVYVDYWHFDENYIASYATPSGVGTPWELLYAMDELVFNQRRAAYSDTAAARYNVPWISLVLARDARAVRRALLGLKNAESFPEAVFTLPGEPESLVDAATADARYQATLDWFDEYEHLVISNGPFFLARYDAPAQFAELDAYRDEDYPFTAADLYRGIPQLIEFIDTNADDIVLGEDYEATFTLSGPGELAVRYLFVDAASGQVIVQGDAEAVSETEFSIVISGDDTFELDAGLYRLILAASSDSLAQLTERVIELEADIF